MKSIESKFSPRTLSTGGYALKFILSLFCLSVSSQLVAQTPSISGFSGASYIERAPALALAPWLTIGGTHVFSDSWIEFEISSATATETLGYPTVASAITTNGSISIVGTGIYRGNGSTADQIGSVDETFDGQAGRKLRFNFSSPLPNAQFILGTGADIPGWTANNYQIYPGTVAAHVALFPRTQGNVLTRSGSSAPYTMTRSGVYSYQTDVSYSGEAQLAEGQSQRGLVATNSGGTPGGGEFTTTIVSDPSAVGGKALRLFSNGWLRTTNPSPVRYGSAFGPEVWSSVFSAAAGDDLALDWRATGTGDDYEVYGYLVRTSDNQHTLLFYGRGGTQSWTTSTAKIPASGEYRFRFINGSFDRTGGYLLGAEFYIDNVRVLSATNVGEAEAQALGRLVTYHNESCTPPTSRTVTFRARNNLNSTGSASATVSITLANCPPTLASSALNPFRTPSCSPSALFNSTAISTIESGQTLTEVRFLVAGVKDAAAERIVFDGTTIELVAGSGVTSGNAFNYSATAAGETVNLVFNKASGVTPATLQGLVDNMRFVTQDVPLTLGERTVTITAIRDNGGTANGGVDEAALSIASVVTVRGVPVIITADPVVVNSSTATLGGNIPECGNTTILTRGVVYSTSPNPTTVSHSGGGNVTMGSGLGTFSSDVGGLSPTTVYYVRAYATNEFNTYYGNEVSFTITPPNPTGASTSVAAICNGGSVELTAAGAYGTVYWYSDSCGGTLIGSGNPLTVSPTVTTTYYARNANFGIFSAGCASVTVTVYPLPTATAGGSATILDTASHTVTGTSAAHGTVLWSHDGQGTLQDETTLAPTYNASLSDAGNTVTLTLTVTSTTGCGEATATYPLTVVGSPAKLAVVNVPVGGQAGKLMQTTPLVHVLDTNNNLVTSATNTITVAILAGSGGSLGGTITIDAVAGVASFADLTMAGITSESYSLRFSAAGLPSTDFEPVTLSPGDPAKITIVQQPVSTTAGVAIPAASAAAPAVLVSDFWDNPVLAGIGVAVRIGSGSGTIASGSTTATTNASGIATFPGLVIEQADTGYTLTFEVVPELID